MWTRSRLARWPGAAAALVVLVGAAAYSNSLHASFHLDDEAQIVANPHVRDPGRVARMLFGGPSGDGDGHAAARSLGLLSFALNYRLGGLDPLGYHLVNLAIHLGAALVLARLGRLTFRLATGRDGAGARWTGLVAGLLFVAHPLQTQAVTYLVQRFASLATLLYLSSLLLYAEARVQDRPGRAGRRLATAVACALLAMRTKEIAFTLPLAAALYEAVFLRGSLRRRAAFLAPMLLTLPVIPLARLWETGGDLGAATRVQTTISRWEYLLTQSRAVATYLRLLALPVGQNLDHDYQVSRSLQEPGVLAAVALLAGLAGAGAILLRRGRDPSHGWARVAGFGVLFFFLGLSVESSLVPIVDVVFEHRAYLPDAGVFLAVAAGTAALRERLEGAPAGRMALRGATALAVMALAWATHARNRVWKDEVTLWRDVAEKSPGKARAHVNLGMALYDAGDSAGARHEWELALRLDPGDATAHFNMGNLALDAGDLASARVEWETAVRLEPGHSRAHNQLGNLRRLANDPGGAIRCFRLAVAADRTNAEAQYNLAGALEAAGDRAGALEHYRAFLRAEPASLPGPVADARRRLATRGEGP